MPGVIKEQLIVSKYSCFLLIGNSTQMKSHYTKTYAKEMEFINSNQHCYLFQALLEYFDLLCQGGKIYFNISYTAICDVTQT